MKSQNSETRLIQKLVELGFIDATLQDAIDQDGIIDSWLMQNHINADQLAQAQASLFHMPYVSLDDAQLAPEMQSVFPVETMYQYKAVPVEFDENTITVAVSDPHNLELLDIFESITGMRVVLAVTSAEAIDSYMKRNQGHSDALQSASRELANDGRPQLDETRTVLRVVRGGEEAESTPVVIWLDRLLIDALEKRASDIHIQVDDSGIVVKYRVNGVLYQSPDSLARSYHEQIVARIKVMAGLDIAEKRKPQDGRFGTVFDDRNIDFRVSVLPSLFGEDVVIRILDKAGILANVQSLSLDALGLTDEVVNRFRRIVHEPYGMVLIAGPTGSGKTTTLYAAISELNTQEEKVITIEDPVEYQLPGVVQIPVNEKKGMGFANGLRSILRHDPDKVMVGEIRDAETAKIAVQSALTGHLVFSTVHANSSTDVVTRLTQMGVDQFNLVSALTCVMAQRLVRTVCEQCAERVHIDAELAAQSGLTESETETGGWRKGEGCDHCLGTGYSGRTAITELLPVDDDIREHIMSQASGRQLLTLAREKGLATLREQGLQLARQGVTTLEEVNRVTFAE